jgi:glycosyltransferase involved in cell wall biosynthesis
MRIALITATPQSVAAGSGTYVAGVGLADGLRSLGHQVVLVTPATPPGMLGVTTHRFRFNRALTPDRVVGADLVVGFDMDGYRLAGRTPTPFAAYIHGQLADEARFERGAVALSMRLQARAERTSVLRADRVLTVSDHARRRIADLYGRPIADIHIVPPALDVDRWTKALGTARLAAADQPPTVLCVCRLYPRKDVASLVQAAAVVCKDIPSARFQIIGDGPDRVRLDRLVRRLRLGGAVELCGQVTFEELVAGYAACDIFCLPSRQEGFGIVFLEAMAAGKPVVACRGTGAEELIRSGEAGLLVPQHDPEALAAALLGLLRDPEQRRRLGAAGPPTARRFTPEPIARRLLEAMSAEPEGDDT